MNFRILLTIPLITLSLTVFGQNHTTVRITEGTVDTKIIIVRGSGESEIIELEPENKPKQHAEIVARNFSKINSMLDKLESEGYELQQSSTSRYGIEILTTMTFRKK